MVLVVLLYLSGQNESGANKNNESEKAFVKMKENVLRQNNFTGFTNDLWQSPPAFILFIVYDSEFLYYYLIDS